MSSGNLEDFVAYQRSLALFDHVVEDMDAYIQSQDLKRMDLAEEINRILSATINSLEGR